MSEYGKSKYVLLLMVLGRKSFKEKTQKDAKPDPFMMGTETMREIDQFVN